MTLQLSAHMEKYGGTLVQCVVTGLVLTRNHFGFVLLLLAPIFVLGSAYSAFRMWTKPAQRKMRALRMLLWGVTILTIAGFHLYYFQASRDAADVAAQAISLHKERHGAFPQAWESGAAGKRWRIYYANDGGRPQLLYHATFVPFDTYNYDFTSRSWKYVAH